MKDFFNKKRLFQSKSTKTDTTKSKSSSKKFLNRFSKKNSKTPAHTDITAENNTPENVTHETIASETPVINSANNDQNNAHYNDHSVPITNTAAKEAAANYNMQTWYSLKGRIGRVQLLAYSMIWGIVISILIVAAMVTGLNPVALIDATQAETVPIISLVLLLLMIPAWLYSVVILPRRRLHDSGKTGWWLLLYIVPIASLYLLYLLYFKPGDNGVNKYGLPPAPYSKVELVLAILIPIFSILGMGLLSVVSSQMLAMQMAQQDDMTQIEVIDADATNTETEVAEAAQEDVENTDAALEEMDAESAAQVQGAIDNAVNNPSPIQVTYEQFLKEAQAKIYVDKSKPEPAEDLLDNEVFVDEQVDEANQAQVNTEAESTDNTSANNK